MTDYDRSLLALLVGLIMALVCFNNARIKRIQDTTAAHTELLREIQETLNTHD